MSSLNFIPPTPAAASKKSGHGGWNIEDLNSSPAQPLSSPHPARPEIFQLVMDHLPVFFSGARPPAKAKTGQPASSEAPAQKKDEAGKTVADATNGSNPPIPQTKSDLAPSPDTLIPPVAHCGIAPCMTELAVAAAPVVPANSPVNLKTEPSGVVAVDFEHGKSKAALDNLFLNRRGAEAQRKDFSNSASPRPGGLLPAGLSETEGGPTGSSAPAKNRVDLPGVLPPVASGAPGIPAARPANQSSIADPAHGALLPPPEKSGNEALLAKPGGKMPEFQKQPAPIIITPGPRPEPMSPLDSTESTDGTAVAQQDTSMKMATKKTNFSGAKQKLPGAAAAATGENLPTLSKRDVAPATILIRVDPALPSGDGISMDVGAARMILPGAVNVIQFPSAVPQYVERTREMISLQVVHVQEAGADEMHVVIKPDLGLQLSLHLQQRGGGVEVQAVLDRGNFGLLNRHWPELQQQLELRGVRVAPLVNAEPSFGGGSEGFRQPTTSHGQHAGDDADPAEMPAALLPSLPPATATASASAISSRHLETWA